MDISAEKCGLVALPQLNQGVLVKLAVDACHGPDQLHLLGGHPKLAFNLHKAIRHPQFFVIIGMNGVVKKGDQQGRYFKEGEGQNEGCTDPIKRRANEQGDACQTRQQQGQL